MATRQKAISTLSSSQVAYQIAAQERHSQLRQTSRFKKATECLMSAHSSQLCSVESQGEIANQKRWTGVIMVKLIIAMEVV